jgi:hypothetical protein
MELTTFSIPKNLERLVIAPLGDIQWSGHNGPTAKDSLKRHIDRALKMDAYFVGMGDYIEFMSPSNRAAIKSKGLYDTAMSMIEEKALQLMEEVYDEFLKPTTGRWLGLVEGHHMYEGGGWTTDERLADKLKTSFLGTSAYIRIPSIDLVLWVHHGVGAGTLPGTGLNRLYHVQGTQQGADVYLMGHNTKLASAAIGRTFPTWGKRSSEHELNHRNVQVVNTGGFAKALTVGSRQGTIKRGGYAEQGLMNPSPIRAPFVIAYLDTIRKHFNESVWIQS